MNEEEVIKIINLTVLKLKMAGLMKDNRKTAYQKTEELLRNYVDFKESDQEITKKLVTKIEEALEHISDDIYYEIIPMIFFENQTRQNVAEYFNTTERTITRNKSRLVNILKNKLFSDDVIFELFL